MSIQRLSTKDALVLAHPGKRSEQFVSPRNGPEATTTITRVTLLPRAVSKPHSQRGGLTFLLIEIPKAFRRGCNRDKSQRLS